MFCLGCTSPSADGLCALCRGQMRPAPAMVIAGGVLVNAAFTHEGAAKRLIHALKYHRVEAAVAPFAIALLPRVPETATALVPVPRAWSRKIRYGVDPARVLAGALSRLSGVPVVEALYAPPWWPRHAGATRARRAPVRFIPRQRVDGGAVLLDDVVTTGRTVAAAAMALGGRPSLVLAGTVAPIVRSWTGPAEVA